MNSADFITVKVPQTHFEERSYIVETLFNTYLSTQIIIEKSDLRSTTIIYKEKTLVIEDYFFNSIQETDSYFQDSFMPEKVRLIRLPELTKEQDLPLVYGENRLELLDNTLVCHIDIFSTCFFFLSRWEELLPTERDEHNRFPILGTYGFRNNIHMRPIVDEYAYFLERLLQKIGLKCNRTNSFSISPTCDVDLPIDPHYHNFIKLTKGCLADIIKRRSLKRALNKIGGYRKVLAGGFKVDPNYTFDYQMDMAEKNGLKHRFYFISGHSSAKDGYYSLQDKVILQLLQSINNRGHEIGIHFSYNSYNDIAIMKRELQNLQNTLQRLGIDQNILGGRQHFLRFEMPVTLRYWSELGLKYDSTMAYAEHSGFRAGTCSPFPVFDVIERMKLTIVEKPLTIMECTFLDEKYMDLGYSNQTLDYMLGLRSLVKKYNGEFTLLWHNSYFTNERDFEFYEALIS
jgi:hypothetical protein